MFGCIQIRFHLFSYFASVQTVPDINLTFRSRGYVCRTEGFLQGEEPARGDQKD